MTFFSLPEPIESAILFAVIYVEYIRNKKLTKRAQELRTQATEQENRLWYAYLRTYPVQFRRQVTMNRFIVDFYCARAKLILEIDGSQHFTEDGEAYDSERTAILESFGYKVLRISNEDVNHNFSGVCEMIDKAVKDRIQLLENEKRSD